MWESPNVTMPPVASAILVSLPPVKLIIANITKHGLVPGTVLRASYVFTLILKQPYEVGINIVPIFRSRGN